MNRLARILLLAATLVGLAAFAAMPRGATGTEWQGRKLPNTPTDFIFGYGSLINTASRNATSVRPIPAIPVRVSASFGYIRSWNDRSLSGFTALGLRKLDPGETGRTINGVIYPVEGADMSNFDARERGYVRVEVPLSEMEAVGWQRLPATGHVWTYVPVIPVEAGTPGPGLTNPDAMFPLLQSYIDVVVEGALEYGPDFAREMLETTDGWSRFWLNDRELARRPWVHDPRSETVDAMLTSISGPAAQYPSRAFPEMYGARLRAEPDK